MCRSTFGLLREELDLNLLNFSIGFDQFVADLEQHAKGKVGFLDGGQRFRLAHVTTGQHRMHHVVGVDLHGVHMLDLIAEHVGEDIDS